MIRAAGRGDGRGLKSRGLKSRGLDSRGLGRGEGAGAGSVEGLEGCSDLKTRESSVHLSSIASSIAADLRVLDMLGIMLLDSDSPHALLQGVWLSCPPLRDPRPTVRCPRSLSLVDFLTRLAHSGLARSSVVWSQRSRLKEASRAATEVTLRRDKVIVCAKNHESQQRANSSTASYLVYFRLYFRTITPP